MKKYITSIFAILSVLSFGQVTIGKTTGANFPANTTVSVEYGDAAGGVKGLVLPWVTSSSAVGSASPTPVAGTLIYDSTDKKVKFGRASVSGSTTIASWEDLSAGAFAPISTIGNADANIENTSSKVQIGGVSGDTTNGIMVLADADKAMILPRVNSYADIVNPSPGMMVYVTGTTPQQLAFYNGREWSFWTKP